MCIKKNVMGGTCGTYEHRRGAYRVLVGNLREINHLEELHVNGRIILTQILRKQEGRTRTRLICLRIRTCGGLL